ncbi:aminotransferase family protein [Thalassobacillus hwangdonensis]|uniref:Aspartate aminotransferase family protein n=1 Tax=Thalassobacillus hwangdonensis TaxID=546108 RepID=A0ABW3KUP6_9BACI
MINNLSMDKLTPVQLAELDRKHFLHPTTNPKAHAENGPKAMFSEGKGIYVSEMEGVPYIDGVSMLWNVNIGHGNQEIAEVAKEQMSKLAYSSSFNGFSNEPAVRLAEKLATLAPGNLNSVFFTSGGSESNDTAFKLARFYWELNRKPLKRKIIALGNSYHGVTIAAQTATSIPNFHSFTNSKIKEVFHAKPHLTECERGDKNHPDYEGCIRDIVEKEGADTIAAVIMEPVQGAGGVHIPPEGYMAAVRKLCDDFNILLIADEVITGFGRTGTMFGSENWEAIPDLLCFAKGVTSGYAQLGGVMLSQNVRDTIVEYEEVLSHGFTYSGHATSCAVALKNIEIIERENLVANAKNMEVKLKAGLEYLSEKHKIVTKPRAIGLLSAIDLYQDPANNVPFEEGVMAAAKVWEACFERKLIARPIRFAKGMNTIALAPPLIINNQQIEDVVGILDDAISEFSKSL